MPPRRRPDLVTPAYRKARAELRALGLPCWLCGQPIRYDLKHPHPRSFSADHVTPPRHGGQHEGNLRAAHLGCNSRRAALEQQGHRFDVKPEREW
jgi:5-methylcytosine-specific restriction endonuclease McrA